VQNQKRRSSLPRCRSGGNEQLSSTEPLFFPFKKKIPDFLSCPIKVAFIDIPPYVILTQKYTQTEDNTVYKLRELEIEYLRLVEYGTPCLTSIRLNQNQILVSGYDHVWRM
jgi:hypothetical protein